MVPSIYPRFAESAVVDGLGVFRVVIVNGPRQAGKSTLLRLLAEQRRAELVTLDDRDALRAAIDDPAGVVHSPGRLLFIDEVQRGGDGLVLAIKAEVDRRGEETGQYVLSGSSRFLTVPTLTESLAGRARIVDLWPLSQGELRGVRERFIDRAFGPGPDIDAIDAEPLDRRAVMDCVVKGGFPAACRISSARDRETWFSNYARTLVERDIADLRRIRQAGELPNLIRLVAAWTAQEFNVSKLARAADLPEPTARDYLALLSTIYVHHLVPNWRATFVARAKRRPKLHAVDTGLACDALGVGVDALARPGNDVAGPLLESFVVNELSKQLGWSEVRCDLHHFRDQDGREVDVILQARDGSVVAIEVKAARQADDASIRSLAWLRDRLGDRFARGIVLHLGERTSRLGDRIVALPVSALWAS